jgi:hypothetical protein
LDDVSRSDATKDCKFGALSGSQRGLIELAALVFYKVVILLKMQALGVLLFEMICMLHSLL